MADHRELRMSGEERLVVPAPPMAVYECLANLARMGEWSPETTAVEWIEGVAGEVGSRFRGTNEARGHRWTTECTVTDADPGRLFGFVVGRPGAGATRWRFTFRAAGANETEITEQFEWEWQPQQAGFRAQVAAVPFDQALKLTRDREKTLRGGARVTLERLRDAARELDRATSGDGGTAPWGESTLRVERCRDLAFARVVATAIGSALRDDPLTVAMFRDPNFREQSMMVFLEAFADAFFGSRVIFNDTNASGGAIWTAPGTEIPPQQFAAFGRAVAPLAVALPPGAWESLMEMRPREPHWCLDFLGVLEHRRNRGLGSGLIAPVLRRCDVEGHVAWTVSTNPRNMPFYERHGFQKVDERPAFTGGPRGHSLLRLPAVPR